MGLFSEVVQQPLPQPVVLGFPLPEGSLLMLTGANSQERLLLGTLPSLLGTLAVQFEQWGWARPAVTVTLKVIRRIYSVARHGVLEGAEQGQQSHGQRKQR